MKYKYVDNKIIFDKPIKKGKDNIKIYFYRFADERKTTDLPVATTYGNNTREYDMTSLKPVMIHTVHIRQPKLFGLIKGKWEIVDSQ